jgi:two-component system OmpR family sensor kinase
LKATEMWSLERRLRNHLLAALTLLWLLGSGLGLFAQWQEMGEVLDADQEETAINLLRLPTPNAGLEGLKALPEPQTAHNQATLSQVFTMDGKLVWHSLTAPDKPLAPLTSTGFANQGDWRLVVRAAPGLNRVAVVATSLRDRREALIEGAQALFLPLLILLPLTEKGLTWLLRRTFSQLDALRQELKSREQLGLEPLPVEGLPNEIAPVVFEINQLFAQLQRAREAERSFAANSAHELRTPIAAAQAQLQRLAREVGALPDVAPERHLQLSQRVDAMARQLHKLQRLCVKLMQLSRANSGVAQATLPVNLMQLAQMVMEEFAPAVQQGRLVLEEGGDAGEVMALGDLDTLGIALRNLIENALEHSGETSRVRVRITNLPTIEVIDNGPGMSEAERQTLTQPFQRGTTSGPGHGIGLAIVNAVAQQMQGHLELISPHEGGPGLQARIHLRPVLSP